MAITVVSSRIKQMVLKADSGSFVSGAFASSDAIPVEISVDFAPEIEKYEIDVASDKLWKNEGLTGGAKNKATAKTFLCGAQPASTTVWTPIYPYMDTIFKASSLSATPLTRIEVTASNALIKRGSTISATTPSVYSGKIAHDGTIAIGGKYYVFVTGITGTVGISSASTTNDTVPQNLTTAAATPSFVWGVEYSQNHANQTTYSSALWTSGLVQKMYGALGNLKIDFEPSKVGMVELALEGIYSADTAVSGDLTTMGLPLESTNFPSANSAPKARNSAITIGASTNREFRKISLDFGIKPEIRQDISAIDGYQQAVVMQTEPKVVVEMATSVSNMSADRALLVAGTPFQNISGLIGNTLGNSFYFIAEKCQLEEFTDADSNKIVTNNATFNAIRGISILAI